MLICLHDHLVAMICLDQRRMWLADGREFPIIGLRDAWNDETDVLEDAVTFIGGNQVLGYTQALLADFVPPTIN